MPTTIIAKGPHGEDLKMTQGEDGVWRTVATTAPPPPVSAPLDHPLLGQLRSRTKKVRERVQRAPAYNHKPMWFMKPDGDVVRLQGDPGSRAYYEDKGYVPLTADETRLWERDQKRREWNPQTGEMEEKVVSRALRKQVISLQRERAALITTIREIASRHAAVQVSGDLSITPLEELEAMVAKLERIDGPNFTLLRGRDPDLEREYKDDEDETDGAEVGSGDDLERKMARSAAQQRLQRSSPMGPVSLT
jgi:hypothetical protein